MSGIGTIEVVLCKRDRLGRVLPDEKESFKTFARSEGADGGGEWLGRQVRRAITRGAKKCEVGSTKDKFFCEGDYAPKAE